MTSKINKSPELDQALQKDESVFLVDACGQTTHVIFPVDEARLMFNSYLRHEIQRGLDQIGDGDVAEWNLNDVLSEAHKRHANKID